MAVDEWLLETTDLPLLRIYGWKGKWGSIGVFNRLIEARDHLSDGSIVRRSTGGGVVDHQNDWTYSLVIPETSELAQIKAVESYRLIHERLSLVLSDQFNLSFGSKKRPEVGGACFELPVDFDVLDETGKKIAGAGQRRTKEGLLHQGSVAGYCNPEESRVRSHRLASALSSSWDEIEMAPPSEVIHQKVVERYGNDQWTRRR